MKRIVLLSLLIVAFGSNAEVKRPKYDIDLSNPYSTDQVVAYSGDHAAVYKHIDANLDAQHDNLQHWMRQQTNSAQNLGLQDMAE